MPVDVGIYTRLSDDGTGEALAVARQSDDGHGLCQLRRWRPVKVYEDIDFSAYQRRVKRPDFERMLTDLHAGTIQGIVVYDLDRLVRQPRDLELLIDIFEDHPEYVCASMQGDIDLSSDDGRTMARVLVAFANKSSADTARRVKRKQLSLATEGKLHGGRVPFGWMDDGVTVDSDAKREILEAQRRVIAGVKLSEIRADWHERGIRPRSRNGGEFRRVTRKGVPIPKTELPTHEPLSGHNIRLILTSPALAGVKVYKGEIMRDDEGNPIPAAWEAICTQGDIDAVKAALDGRRTTKGRNAGGARRYLLSGIARCGVCGRGLRGSFRKTAGGPRFYYICDGGGIGGCGKLARIGEPVDKLIISIVLADEEGKRSQASNVPDWGKEQRLQTVLREIKELTDAKIAGKISVSALIQVLPPLEEERDALQAEKRKLIAQATTAAVLNESTHDDFDRLPLGAQRERILRSLQAVVIHPVGRGRRTFNPDLIEPVWV